MQGPYLKEIHIYPVKSLAGIKVDRWPVIETGLQYDRQWMLVDENRQFLSQRRLPRMALIKTELTDTQLVLSAPYMQELALPLHVHSDDEFEVAIWQDRCPAYSVSNSADQWFSDYLNFKCRLVYQPTSVIRSVDPKYGRSSDRTAFSDGFPFLLISENSLRELNRQMGMNYPMIRFRPNLVIAGCPGYAEDAWRNIRIGEIDFRLPKPCSRCTITTIDPATGETGKEPLQTLSHTRKWQQKVYFGQNALHDNSGHLSIGDPLQVYSTGLNQPPL
ncbi:MAG: MOSC domain-containing protein [Gammaproteobacteria bacterium]